MNIGVMYKIRSMLPLHALYALYNTTILPHLNYCNLIWGRASASLLKRLVVLQKQVVRLCTGSHYRAHTQDLFQRLGILPISDLITFKTGIFMHNFSHNNLPPAFTNYFKCHNEIHSKNTRHQSNIYPSIFRTVRAQKQSMKFHGTNIWNSGIPETLKTLPLHRFKTKFRNFLTIPTP